MRDANWADRCWPGYEVKLHALGEAQDNMEKRKQTQKRKEKQNIMVRHGTAHRVQVECS